MPASGASAGTLNRLGDLVPARASRTGSALSTGPSGKSRSAVHFLKRAGELPEYKHFVGKLGSVFFVPGAEPIDLEDRRKELAYEMMKLGFLTAELPHRILAHNEVYRAAGYG